MCLRWIFLAFSSTVKKQLKVRQKQKVCAPPLILILGTKNSIKIYINFVRLRIELHTLLHNHTLCIWFSSLEKSANDIFGEESLQIELKIIFDEESLQIELKINILSNYLYSTLYGVHASHTKFLICRLYAGGKRASSQPGVGGPLAGSGR